MLVNAHVECEVNWRIDYDYFRKDGKCYRSNKYFFTVDSVRLHIDV